MESAFWQIHGEMEGFNQFCPCHISYSNLLSMPNTGAAEEMFGSKTALGSSLHPSDLLTVLKLPPCCWWADLQLICLRGWSTWGPGSGRHVQSHKCISRNNNVHTPLLVHQCVKGFLKKAGDNFSLQKEGPFLSSQKGRESREEGSYNCFNSVLLPITNPISRKEKVMALS